MATPLFTVNRHETNEIRDPNMLNIFTEILGPRQYTVQIVGLPQTGKTSLLYRIKKNKTLDEIPKIDIGNIEEVNYEEATFKFWDISTPVNTTTSSVIVRPEWVSLVPTPTAVIFMIDSSDLDNLGNVIEALKILLNDPTLQDSIFLIFANKQDLNEAFSPNLLHLEFKDLLDCCNQKWVIQGSSALQGHGIDKGIRWLYDSLREKLG